MDKRMILVCGFPHGGTTIIRKLIGNIEGMYDYTSEIDAISGVDINTYISKIKDTDYKAIVVKSPFTPKNITTYKNFKIVFILRNPWDCFGSFRKRFKVESHYTHAYVGRYGIGVYADMAKTWLEVRNNPDKYPNIYPIKYEEMFENDYSKIRDLVNWLGFPWSDDIIHSDRIAGHQNWNNRPVPKVDNPNELRNTGADNVPLRYWQINQPFHDMTGESRNYIFKTTKTQLDNLSILDQLDYRKYGDYEECERAL